MTVLDIDLIRQAIHFCPQASMPVFRHPSKVWQISSRVEVVGWGQHYGPALDETRLVRLAWYHRRPTGA